MRPVTELRKRLDGLYRKRLVVGLSQKESAQLPTFLADPDLKFRFYVGDLIRRNGKAAAVSLIGAATSESEAVRRSSIHLLGKIARKLTAERQGEITKTVVQALVDVDPKVRRNAAIALGDLRATTGVKTLETALNAEPFDWVRPSMVLALGQIGGEASSAVLGRLNPRSAEETEALAKAQDRVTVIDHPGREPLERFGGEREIELRSAPGVEEVLCDVFEEVCGRRPRIVQTGAVRVCVDELRALRQVRIWREWLVPAGEIQLGDRSEAGFERAGLELLEIGLRTVGDIYGEPQNASRFRIEVRGKEISHVNRRKLIGKWAKRLAISHPEFVNSPSHYDVELRLQRAKTQVKLYLHLTSEPDTRFDYRVEDVPASMHPATAATVVRVAERQDGKPRVFDPFCGCGTMLFERLRSAQPVGELVGCDVSGNAIQAAQTNLDRSGDDNLRFARGDVRFVKLDGRFDELISNLPYGIRTGSHGKNVEAYAALFERLPEWMNDGASISLVTQEMDLMERMFSEHKSVQLLNVHRVDTGGLQPGVFTGVFRK